MFLKGRGADPDSGVRPGLRAFWGPDSCSPRRFAPERDGQIENASILDRFRGSCHVRRHLEDNIGVLKSREKYQCPISTPGGF